MVSWMSNWAQGIIVAVIIATIVEMILPQGTIKKYIKVVIGMYILFAIVSPIIAKISGGKIDVNNIIDTSAYAEEINNNNNKISKKLDSNSSRTIKDIYIENLKSDIKSKVKSKGYSIDSIYIDAKDDKNYTIEKINLCLEKASKNKENTENEILIQINEIGSSYNNTEETHTPVNRLSNAEKQELKTYLADIYSINTDIIYIE